MDCSLSGSSVHGILQARILEWVAIPSPGDLPNPGIKLRCPALRTDSLPAEPPGETHNFSLFPQISTKYIYCTFLKVQQISKNDSRVEVAGS